MNKTDQQNNEPAISSEEDYNLIEGALLQNPRGRWFLEEYIKRNRPEDTQKLLEAMHRIENNLQQKTSSSQEEIDPIRMSIIEMSKAITKTREEINSIKPTDEHQNQLINANEELSAIVESTEKATNTILEAAEEIQEAAWILREAGADGEACDKIDANTTDIYTACSFQDITGQRTNKVVQALCYIENRVNAMIDIWGLSDFQGTNTPIQENEDSRPDSHLLNGPSLEGQGLAQGSVDNVFHAETSVSTDDFDSIETGQDLADTLCFDSIGSESVSIDDISFDAISTEPDFAEADFNTQELEQDPASDITDEFGAVPQETGIATEDDIQLSTEIIQTQAPDFSADQQSEHVITPDMQFTGGDTPEANRAELNLTEISSVDFNMDFSEAGNPDLARLLETSVQPMSPAADMMDFGDITVTESDYESFMSEAEPALDLSQDQIIQQPAELATSPEIETTENTMMENMTAPAPQMEDPNITTPQAMENIEELEIDELTELQQEVLMN